MCFGKDLSNEFHKLTKNGEYQEVELISKLQVAFINLTNEQNHYAKDIIRGGRGLVKDRYNEIWASDVATRAKRRCALSDLMLVIA